MNSNVDADGGFDLRHRALGALVLVVVGVVVLPMILNGASMAPEVVAIDTSDGTKVPRTFETNIRPLNNQDSSVRVESESRDQLKTELSFPKAEGETDSKPARPVVSAENAPAATTDTGENVGQQSDAQSPASAIPEATPVVAEPSSSTTDNSSLDNGVNKSSAVDTFKVSDSGVVEQVNGDTGADTGLSDAAVVVGDASGASDSQAQPDMTDSSATGGESVIEPLPEVVREADPEPTSNSGSSNSDENKADSVKTVAAVDSDTMKGGDSDSNKSSDNVKETNADSATDNTKTEAPKATGTAGWVVRIGTFGEAENAARMVALLTEKGIPGQSSVSKTKSGRTLTRVWVGPFQERDVASRELGKIEKATGEKGFVTAYP